MKSTQQLGAFGERWPEAREFMDSEMGEERLASSSGEFRESAQGHLALAILILRTDDYRPPAGRLQRVGELVRTAVAMAPEDPYVLLFAAMTMLDIRDVRGALEHVKAIRDLGEEPTTHFESARAQAALLHVIGRLVAAGGKNDDVAEELLAAAVDLDPLSLAYPLALYLHRPEYRQTVGARERPSIDQVFTRLPL